MCDSLSGQTDQDFTWLVVEDGGADGTLPWLEGRAAVLPFPVTILVNDTNRGKSASINRAFAHMPADFYLIVDSDDFLLPHAIETVRAKLGKVDEDRTIGAIFFGYVDHRGAPMGAPSGNRDIIMSRSAMDGTHGKYDGCVGYTRSASDIRYPEFDGETYVGPTVLQLLMEPTLKILFTHEIIGVAEYQPDGLTAAGRALRLRNPLGMMCYSRLCASTAVTMRHGIKHRVSYWAYEMVLRRPPSVTEAALLRPQPPAGLYKAGGRLLAVYWQWRTVL